MWNIDWASNKEQAVRLHNGRRIRFDACHGRSSLDATTDWMCRNQMTPVGWTYQNQMVSIEEVMNPVIEALTIVTIQVVDGILRLATLFTFLFLKAVR